MQQCGFILKICFNTFLAFFISSVFFGVLPEANTPYLSDFSKRLQRLLKNPDMQKVSCGISIVSLKKNTLLFNYRDDDLFCIASNMKLLTTSAALEYLGPDFEYKTSVETDGYLTSSGELKGNIIIKGSGDPNISGRFYDGNILAVPESWTHAVKTMGIRRVTGDIIADDSIFDRTHLNPHWPENQSSKWYCAPICGLSFNDNCVDIALTPGNTPGKVVSLLVEPNTAYVTFFNTCIYTANKKEHSVSVCRKPGTNQIFIKGKFWIGASPEKKWITINNPALYLATVFKETLERNGIAVDGNIRLVDKDDSRDTALKVIAETISTMEQTITVTNKHSQNLYAEQILKTLGVHIKGDGSIEAGLLVLRDFLEKLDIQSGDYHLEDGCGLSKGNRLSPKVITRILGYMYKHPRGKVLYDSLPISGTDGGLRRRMTSPPYKGRIHAKTGYIAATSALSGYIDTENGDILAFSILMNGVKNLSNALKIQDDICKMLVDCYN